MIEGPDAKRAVAELVAALYDESLDAYKPHDWMRGFSVFRQDHSNLQSQFENMLIGLNQMPGGWPVTYKDASYRYRAFPQDIVGQTWQYGFGGGRGARRMSLMNAAPGAPAAA